MGVARAGQLEALLGGELGGVFERDGGRVLVVRDGGRGAGLAAALEGEFAARREGGAGLVQLVVQRFNRLWYDGKN